jgi:Outer membrane protein beta-barrel domain
MRRRAWVLMAATSVTMAGAARAAELRAGVWGGANVASLEIEGAPRDERESRTAAAFGALFAWRPAEAWSLELRPAYVGRGAMVDVEGARADIRSNFVELPLLVTRDLGGSRVRPYLLAGAALGHRTSAKAVFGSDEQDISDDFARTDVSLRAGAGLRARLSHAQPFLAVEYMHGLKDLNPQRAGIGSGVGSIKNRGIQVRAGVSFGFGGR